MRFIWVLFPLIFSTRLCPNRTEIDLRFMQKILSTAYCKVGLADWTCARCQHTKGTKFLGIVSEKRLNVNGMIVYSPTLHSIILVFRGTKITSIRNWILDANVYQTPLIGLNDPKVLVHSGFQSGYEALADDLLELVRNATYTYPNATIRVVGHRSVF